MIRSVYIVHTGMQWRMLPSNLPSWHTVYQQTQRWLKAGVFEAIVHDLRSLLCELAERAPSPRAALLDGRTLPSTPESGARAGYDGHKRRKVHMAGDTLGHLLAVIGPATPMTAYRVPDDTGTMRCS